MITNSTLKQSKPFDKEERDAILSYISECYGYMPWLSGLCADVRFSWCDILERDGVVGAFSPSRPNDVFLMRVDIRMLTSTAIHELTHMKQYRELGWRYHLCVVPLLRETLLEKEARANEFLADQILQTNQT